MKTVFFTLSFCVLHSLVMGSETFLTFLESKTVEMICPSKEPPIWERFTKLDVTKLAVGMVARSSFVDKRYVTLMAILLGFTCRLSLPLLLLL